MCAEWISASRTSTSLMWVMPPGISSALSSRKTSGEGQQQPLVYSIHGCNRTMAAIPRSHWTPPAWRPSSSAAGISTTCTRSPASRASCWAGWTRARSASIHGILHCCSWAVPGVPLGARGSVCTYPMFGVCVSPSAGWESLQTWQWDQGKGGDSSGDTLPLSGHVVLSQPKRTAGGKHQLGMRAKIAVALIFVRQPYKKSSWSCWTEFKMYKTLGVG